MRVLLIGNAPCALDRRVGAEVDAFEGVVVRMNLARLDHEDGRDLRPWIGERTDTLATCIPEEMPAAGLGQSRVLVTVPWGLRVELPVPVDRVSWGEYHTVRANMRYAPTSGALAAFWFYSRGHEVEVMGMDYGRSHAEYWHSGRVEGWSNGDHSSGHERAWFEWRLEHGVIAVPRFF